jgi:hypothetical protein
MPAGMRAVSRRCNPERYLGTVTPRWRVLAFGSATALVVAGSICAALSDGRAGDATGIALITLGLGAVVLLVFLEVGLSEERELAKEEKRRQRAARPAPRRRPLRRRRRP